MKRISNKAKGEMLRIFTDVYIQTFELAIKKYAANDKGQIDPRPALVILKTMNEAFVHFDRELADGLREKCGELRAAT